MKAIYFDGPEGNKVRVEPVPESLIAFAKEKKLELIGALAENEPKMEEYFLEENVEVPV